jgi:hypothetical protein
MRLPDNGPDWGQIGAALTVVGTIVGAIIATARGAVGQKRQHTTDEEDRRLSRDKAATDNAALTLEGVFRLVNELQEELGRKATQIIESDRHCTEGMNRLQQRIAGLERQIEGLKRQVELLKRTTL